MLSITEMAVLGAAALMFFGPEQLPKVARKAGLLIREVQNTSHQFIREMERAAEEPAPDGTAAYANEPYAHAYGSNGTAEYGVAPEPTEPAPAPDAVHDRPQPHAAKPVAPDHDLPP